MTKYNIIVKEVCYYNVDVEADNEDKAEAIVLGDVKVGNINPVTYDTPELYEIKEVKE